MDGSSNLFLNNFQNKQRFIIFNEAGDPSGNGVKLGTIAGGGMTAGSLTKGEKVSGYCDSAYDAMPIFYDKTNCGLGQF